MEFGNRRFGGGGDRRGGGSGPRRNFNNGPRQMHKITCSSCGKESEVPFKPIEGRPVFCRDCYQNQKGESSAPRRENRNDAQDDDVQEE